MYLRRMVLQALGPFAGTHTIDFAELGASGLYLLEGPTGAGKSTLIDAVVFALYGKVASAATSDDRLRSGYAADGVDTVVDLVFETGSGIYRVRRTPERLRAKKRGTGTTKQQATIRLWRLASADEPDGGELLSTRLDEAGPEIQRAIGLDRAQFVQTIVLPQGEFASFLRANPEERRGLLQKVFGTEVYERVQVELAGMRAAARATVDEARAGAAGAAAHFVGAASVTDDPAFGVRRALSLGADARGATETATTDRIDHGGEPGAGDPVGGVRLATATELRALGEAADPALLGATQAHARALAREAEVDAVCDGVARTGLRTAREALESARALADAVARRDTLRTEHAGLLARRDEHETAVRRREAAGRAAVVATTLTGAEAAATALDAADRTVQRLRQAAPDLAALDGEALARARETLAAQAARLDRVERLERELPARRAHLARQEGILAADDAENAALRAELEARPALRASLEQTIDDLGDPAADLAVTRVGHAAARDRLAAAVAAAQHAVAVEADLRRRRLAGMAGELAVELLPGGPCPVCGAAEHPAPAALAPDHPDAAQVTEGERRREAAEALSSAALAEVTALTGRVAAERAIAGTTTLARHEADLGDLAVRVAQAQDAVARLALARRALTGHDTETDVLLDRERTLHVAVERRRAQVSALVTAIEADAKEVDAARVGAPTVAARLGEIQREIRTVTQLAQALASSVAAAEHLRQRTAELDTALAEQGLPDAAAARAALLPTAELRRLDAGTTAYVAAAARVEAGLAEPAIAALTEDVTVDLASDERTCADAEERAAQAARQATLSGRCAQAAAAGVAQVEAALATHATARRAAEPVIRMADLASASGGDNAKRLTLATYVLTRRFEDVVAAANDRLAGMSDGRFELVRSEEREDVRTHKRGLAMKVVDHRIEVERDPRTLSGGETFYVSLCLALGMADVVTAEAGGIDLGTLFVDEGFGTLDPETLEAVLTELGKLRAGGRVVGVVSHVEALKQSIAERIEVRRLADGSSTLTVRAG